MRWLFLEEILELEPGVRARARASYPEDPEVMAVHFPWQSIVPGVLHLEAMAQLAGKLIMQTLVVAERPWRHPILTLMQGVKFRSFVDFGARVEVEVELIADGESRITTRGRVRDGDGRGIAGCEQLFTLFDHSPGTGGRDIAEALVAERDDLKRIWPRFEEGVWERSLEDLRGRR